MSTPACLQCGDALDDYATDDDIGWCTTCSVFVGDHGDFPFDGLQCPACGAIIDLAREHRPEPWEFDRGTLDDQCGSCERKTHPSLTAAERNH